MVKYHPDVRFLTDYSAGSLPKAQALCVSTHLHFCDACRAKVRELNELGSVLFTQQAPVAMAGNAFDRLVGRINQAPATLQPAPTARPAATADSESGASNLPRAIAKLCNGNLDLLNWRKIGRHFRFAALKLGDRQRETSLLHIKAGGSVPQHRHKGDEITVVIKGSFSDQEDKYSVGDFIVRTQGETHRPVASQDEDCLCLTTLDAPIEMSNWVFRLLSPFFNRQPA